MFSKIAPYGKAITGAVVTGLGAARLALSDDIITKGESIDIAIATLTALAVVWAVPNADKVTTLMGRVTSETGETGVVSATLTSGDGPSEATGADLAGEEGDDGLSYKEAGGRPYGDAPNPSEYPRTVEDGSPDRY